MTDDKKPRLCYSSEGVDDAMVVCDTIEQAVNCFRADAGATLDRQNDGALDVRIWIEEFTDAEVAAMNSEG